MKYDDWQNHIYERDRNGNEIYRKYSERCQLLEESLPNGLITYYEYDNEHTITYKYNTLNKLSESYTYYPDGRLQTALAGGMRYHCRYDVEGRLIEKSANGRTLLAYSYDLNGNKVTQTDVTGKTTKYCYNILDELTEIIDNETKLASYTYHLDGSLATMHQSNGLYTQYSYDPNKNLSGLEVTLDSKNLVKNAYT